MAILGINSVRAQLDVSFHLGMLFPRGDFAASRIDDGVIAWNSETERAGAGSGFSAGLNFRYNDYYAEGWGIIATADLFFNTPNSDVEDWEKDVIFELEEQEELTDFGVTVPHYINIPIMMGLNYQYCYADNIKIWGEAEIGVNIGALTNFKLFRSGEYDYYDSYDYEYTTIYSYTPNASFAFQFGAGIMTHDRYSLGVHFYSLGSQKIKGKHLEEHFFNGEHYSYKEDFSFKSINPKLLTISVGYHF